MTARGASPEPGAISPVWDALRGDGLPEAANDRVVLRRDAVFRRSLALADVVAATLALVFALGIAGDSLPFKAAAVFLFPAVILAAKSIGLYDRDQHQLRKTTIDDAPSVLHLAVLFTLAVWFGEGFFVEGSLGRPEVLWLASSTFALTLLARGIARTFALAVTPVERCIVLGNSGSADRIAQKLHSAPSVNAEVIGRVALDDGRYEDRAGAPKLLGRSGSLAMLLAQHAVERVVIAPDGHDQDQILHAIRLTKALGVKVSVLPRLLEVVGSSSTFDEVDGITLLGVRRYGLSHSSELLKRSLDVAAAAAGLLLLAPMLLAFAVAVTLDSRGPVFFRQRRIGRNGDEFSMLKFRSMVEDAEGLKDGLRLRNEATGLFKISDDPRITRVGGLLRRTSLDELPQLLNVLKGHMSLVGPRPLVPDEDAMIEGWQRRRLAVKPGMTGLWQVFGSSRIPMQEMVKIDYIYGANWSIWLDMKILVRTIPHVLGRRGL